MKSANLLNVVSNYISSGMAQSVYTMSQFGNIYNNSTNFISSSNPDSNKIDGGIICGISKCGKKENEKDNNERCL